MRTLVGFEWAKKGRPLDARNPLTVEAPSYATVVHRTYFLFSTARVASPKVSQETRGRLMADGKSVNPKRPTLKELCELASVEKDSKKLLALAEEINRRLGAGERVAHTEKPAS